MKPRLLLLVPTSTYRAEAFVAAARRLPIDLSIGSETPSSLSHLHPFDLPTIDLSNPARAADQARVLAGRTPFDAVVAVDDRATLAAAVIGEALGLPHNSPGSVRAALDKYLGRERMAQAGLPVPRFRLVPMESPDRVAGEIDYPVVVKPLAMAASRGVVRVDTPGAFVEACRRITRIARSDSPEHDALARTHLLVESYVPGWEVAVEGLLTDGVLHVITIFDKPDPLEGPYFPETLYVTPTRHEEAIRRQLVAATLRAVAALGLREGPVHVELRGNDGGITPIEVHARSIGGLCSRVVRFADGRSLEDVILQHSLGMLAAVPPMDPRAAGVWMMQSPRRGRFEEMRGLGAATGVRGIEEIIVSSRPGQVLEPLPEGFLYMAFIFARGETPAAVEASLRDAFARLDPVVHEVSESARA